MAMFTNNKMLTSFVLLLIFCFVPSYSVDINNASLQLVQVLYRHGDRSPVVGYPKDDIPISKWLTEGAQGYGQLTFVGMQQHYELGQFFKEQYISSDFMNSYYNRTQLQVRSTDVERTLMSAYCNLAGMYPPDDNHTWWPEGANIHWQPIPVHTLPQSQDNLLRMDASCPMAERLYQEEMETKEFKRKARENKALLQFVSNNTGVPHEDLDNMWEVIDTLFCENTHNFTLPPWTAQNWPQQDQNMTVYDRLMALNSWEFDLKFGEPDQKARLRGGPLLKEMLANMKQSIDGKTAVKFFMYSAHDNTVMAFLHALKASNHLQPPYAAAVIVELYETGENDHAVRVMYRNDTSQDTPYNITIPGCKTLKNGLCPYEQFVSLTKSMVPADWDKECEIPEPKHFNERYVIGIGVGAGVVVICVFIAIVFVIKKKKKARNYEGYSGIQTET